MRIRSKDESNKFNRKLFYGLLCLTALFIMMTVGCAGGNGNPKTLFQHSAIQPLLEGGFQGRMTCGDLRKHGNFGIGTFDGLDGEMVVLDGTIYQIRSDGKAYLAADSLGTPFAAVTFFQGEKIAPPAGSLDYGQLTSYLDQQLPTKNLFYAVRIDGAFKWVKTRSCVKQSKPYPRLVEALKNQPEFEMRNVRGTLVGFRCPDYVNGVNVPGYHLHFITEDRSAGGHVLGCITDQLDISMDKATAFQMNLPENEVFYTLDLSAKKAGELEKVEKGTATGNDPK
jgi:acetolactate decarboxylase